MAMKKMKVKANDQIQLKKTLMKKPANAARNPFFKKKPAAMQKVVKKIIKKKPAAMKKVVKKTPKFYTAAFVEGLACEFFIQAVDAATETLCKVYFSKDWKGLEYTYYRSVRPN